MVFIEYKREVIARSQTETGEDKTTKLNHQTNERMAVSHRVLPSTIPHNFLICPLQDGIPLVALVVTIPILLNHFPFHLLFHLFLEISFLGFISLFTASNLDCWLCQQSSFISVSQSISLLISKFLFNMPWPCFNTLNFSLSLDSPSLIHPPLAHPSTHFPLTSSLLSLDMQ